ncbi:MAG: DNA adenine methylase [Chloroflexi bacterium]|nr:DNA adenine methylase [Chloroflexota bacterium]
MPQRSPFRYPGGKTWLVPRVRQWLKSLPTRPTEFIEPFAGGGIIALTAAFENLAEHITMVELDDQVAAVWRTIIYGDGKWLAERIISFECNLQNIERELSEPPKTLEEKAFKTILKNRVYHGGILASGSRPIKYGENGKGISSRWYPKTLKQRILNIMEIRDRLTFIEGDGSTFLKENTLCQNFAFFIDPPYTAGGKKAGTRLYRHFELDHEELFSLVGKLAGDFLMTYDCAEEVVSIATKHGFDMEIIAMKSTHHAKMKELLIGRQLGWLRRSPQAVSNR